MALISAIVGRNSFGSSTVCAVKFPWKEFSTIPTKSGRAGISGSERATAAETRLSSWIFMAPPWEVSICFYPARPWASKTGHRKVKAWAMGVSASRSRRLWGSKLFRIVGNFELASNIYLKSSIWIGFSIGFSMISHLFWGTPIYGNPQLASEFVRDHNQSAKEWDPGDASQHCDSFPSRRWFFGTWRSQLFGSSLLSRSICVEAWKPFAI